MAKWEDSVKIKLVTSQTNFLEFFVACILLPLTYLHQNGIIHRDLKPENLVLDSDGYLRLTDLGIARINKGNNAGDTSGTPGYMGNLNLYESSWGDV